MTPRPAAALALACALLAACGGGGGDAAPACGAPGDGWIAFIQRTTGPFAVVAARLDGSCKVALSAEAASALDPTWSASTARVAWTGSDAGVAALRVHDLVTGVTTTVVVAPLAPGMVALSPDGRTLAFDGRLGAGSPHVYVVPVAGGDPVAVATSAGSDAGPAWSADGRRLLFVSDRGGAAEVWSTGLAGFDPEKLTTGSRVLGRPSASPGGLVLAYARRKPDGTSQVIEHVLATGTERVLSDALDGEPAYDAGGTRLGVSTYRYAPGAPDVVVLDAATGALLSRVTSGGGASGAPAFPR